MDEHDLRDAEFANCIAPHVLEVLRGIHFFDLSDNRLSRAGSFQAPAKCAHSFARTCEILRTLGRDSAEIEDVLTVFSARGACRDCEVLYIVAEESPLKSRCWKQRAAKPKEEM